MAGQIAAEFLHGKSASGKPSLYQNNRDGTFSEVAKSQGLDKLMFAMGSNFGDINSDGYPDFYIGNGAPDFRMIIPNRMFLNADGAGFEEVTYDGGFGHLQKGHAVSFGDLDNDGDQDIYCVMGGSVEGDTYHNLLFENPGNDNAWIALELQGRKSNRKAIGARITISCKTRIGDMKNWYQTVGSGGSFGGSSLRLEVGLGEAVEINHVQVIWPYGEGIPEMFRGLEVSGTYLLVEGRGVPQILPSQSIEF